MQALARLLARGSIERDVGYTRAQLIAAFGEAPGLEPALAFRTLRRLALAEATVAGGHTLVTVGAGRSTRYLVTRRGPAGAGALGRVRIVEGENLDVLCRLADASFRLIYIDPPFNTGREQVRTRLRTERVVSGGDRTGYGGARYRTTVLGQHSYEDSFSDYCGYLEPRLVEARRVLAADGSLFVHLDYREVHYVKILLDRLFGRASFINELIWAYDYGGRSRSRWSPKHDNILWYAKDPRRYVFNYERMERIPYMAPELVGPEKAARGKTPTDVWWHTIVSPNGREKTGYPTQKPVGVLRRFVEVHSDPGDHVLDFFAGSGSFGEASAALGRHATLVDKHPEAIAVMRRRLAAYLAGEGEDMSLGTGLPGASAASSATADGVAEGSKADAGRARAGASIDPAAPPETAAEEASGAWEMHASGVAEASGERV
ncbi:MAG: site-specific DNA-methyltransferase, partial [Myxococcales bacterium]|nr:site-specific DNA-methyltransferase [Myxococcales bacterium]